MRRHVNPMGIGTLAVRKFSAILISWHRAKKTMCGNGMVLRLGEIGSERLPRQTPTATVANVKELSYLVVWIGFEFSDDFDDEGRGDCREDTSLMP